MEAIQKSQDMKVKYIIFIFLFPLLYMVNSFTPWSAELWGNNNHSYYFSYWGSVMFLHWSSVLLVLFFLRKSGMKVADIGFTLKAKGRIIFLAGILAACAFLLIYTEWSLGYVNIDQSTLNGLNNFYPRTFGERIFWIFCALSAGFCEEFVYRGFCIKMLTRKGLNKWLSIVIAAIPFIFIHGYAAIMSFSSFGSYFLFGLAFGVLFVISKRLWIPMMIHILFDAMAIMAIFQFAQ